MNLAPIAVFAFNRPDHLRRCLKSIESAELGKESDITVYCDGPRTNEEKQRCEEVRDVAASFSSTLRLKVVARDENFGLKRSIETGVTETVEEAGRVIVIEDDLELSPAALRYFNEGLERYRDEDRVMHVSGFQFPDVDPQGERSISEPMDVFFLPNISSWGWATWRRAWAHYEGEISGSRLRQIGATPRTRKKFNFGGSYDYYSLLENAVRGNVNSWAIHWYESVFRHGGVSVCPNEPLLHNNGFDDSGTHSKSSEQIRRKDLRRPASFNWPERVRVSRNFANRVQASLLEFGNVPVGREKSLFHRGASRLIGWLRGRI